MSAFPPPPDDWGRTQYGFGGPTPPPPSVVAAGGSRGRRGRWTALAAVVVVLVAAVVTGVVVVVHHHKTAAAGGVTLVPATDAGADPFLTVVGVAPVGSLPGEVQQEAQAGRRGLSMDPKSNTLAAAGATAGLYGGSQDGSTSGPSAPSTATVSAASSSVGLYGGGGELSSCNVGQIAEFLTKNRAEGAAWAGIRGIQVNAIAEYLQSLTPVVLLSDTLVTNHGFRDGAATTLSSVLQAGTAVLLDRNGLPVTRCACGNPLTAPAVTDLPGSQTLGTRWDGYDAGQVVTVTSGKTVKSFVLVDVRTGAPFSRPAGAVSSPTNPTSLTDPTSSSVSVTPDTSAPGTSAGGVASGVLLAVGSGPGDDSSQVLASTDGTSWKRLLLLDHHLRGIGVSDSRVVVVGADPDSGVVLSSTDGSHWTDPLRVDDDLSVVGYGNGTWLAAGPGNGSAPAVYSSADGLKWSKAAAHFPAGTGAGTTADGLQSLSYGDGHWLMTTGQSYTGVAAPGASTVFGSVDGINWQEFSQQSMTVPPTASTPSDESPTDISVAWNGRSWAFTGVAMIQDDQSADPIAGSSTDGATWTPAFTTPKDRYFQHLAWGGDLGWIAVGTDTGVLTAVPNGVAAPTGTSALFASSDAITWHKVGSNGFQASGLARAPFAMPSSAVPTTAASPAITTTSTSRSTPTTSTTAAAYAGSMMYFGTLGRLVELFKNGSTFNIDPNYVAAHQNACAETVIWYSVRGAKGYVAATGTKVGSWRLAEQNPSQNIAADGGTLHQQIILPPLDVTPGTSFTIGANLVVDGTTLAMATPWTITSLSSDGTTQVWDSGGSPQSCNAN